MMKKKNECLLYILAWIIQLVREPFHLYGDSMSVMFLIGLYAWSLYYCYVTITRYKIPPFLKSWSILFLFFSIYAIVRIINPYGYTYNVGFEVNSRMFLIEHWTSMLPIYPFFVFTKRGLLNEDILKKIAIVFIGLAIIRFYYGRSIAISKLAGNVDETFATNNMGYFVVMVMPMMFFWRKRPIIQYFGIAVLMAYVLLSVKRGAILIGLICLLMLIFYSIKNKGNKISWSFILLAIFLVVGFNYVTYLISTNDFFAFRLERTMEGDDSTRSELYSSLYNAFFDNSNLLQLLFGYGADGTILLSQMQAHNDWLEILVDMGLVGFLTFFVFWLRAYSTYKSILNKDLKFLFFIVILMLFVRTFFSMSINSMYISTNLILGYCLANYDNQPH